MKLCVVPGSFDPFTAGHLDLVRRAAKLFDKVYVAIMVNSAKNCMFDLMTRKKAAELSVADMENVDVVTADGLLVDLCVALGADAIVKGIRNGVDYAYEEDLADVNKRIGDVETVWLPANPEVRFVSSTFVRELLRYGRPIDAVVHPAAAAVLTKHPDNK